MPAASGQLVVPLFKKQMVLATVSRALETAVASQLSAAVSEGDL
jgi:hypothetical protein